MPSQEDYANVILALSTLASAPVAAYPESGAMMLAKARPGSSGGEAGR
jgi:hypothetical protein